MRNFKQLQIWKKGILIATNCYKLTATFPKSEQFGLISQLNRACISIPSNIAEGSSRKSEKDYNRFIRFALGSCFEVETQLLIAKQLNFATAEALDKMLLDVIEEEKMLSVFSNVLRNSSPNSL